jgi:hypothetical protein
METTIEVDIAENKKEDKANSHLPEVLTGSRIYLFEKEESSMKNSDEVSTGSVVSYHLADSAGITDVSDDCDWKPILDHFEFLRSKWKKQLEKLEMLEKSIYLKKLCPTAFDSGSCKSYWKTDGSHRPIFEIKKGDESTVTFAFDSVPDFFKIDEANRRNLTPANLKGFYDKRNPEGNDPVDKALTRFLTLKKLNERRNNELR